MRCQNLKWLQVSRPLLGLHQFYWDTGVRSWTHLLIHVAGVLLVQCDPPERSPNVLHLLLVKFGGLR